MSVAHIVEANGLFFTVVFVALSLAAVFFVALRSIKYWRARTDVGMFIAQVEMELETKGGPAAIEFCEREADEKQHVLALLFAAAFKDGQRGQIAARDAIADCLELEIMPSLHKWLPAILMITKVAPMFGLLGTVVGMIGAFETIAGATKVNPSALANDIGMALFTTAEGLFIAIPLILVYSTFTSVLHQFEVGLQRGSQAALRLLPKVYGRS
jgi:biopolymer transport protein ExbB